ncbi:YdcF family protein [Roseomonas sp. BN140053]|uniref:YdcF family protein n=1 Tax=Roseomonas sp. BN140053 TaxID=3391898 RepID=UPI0039E9149B
MPGRWPGRLPQLLRRGLFALAVAGLLLSGGGYAWFLDAAARPAPAEPPPTEGIAVLTGGPERVETGLRLAEAWPNSRLLISGVGQDADLPAVARAAGLEPWPFVTRTTLGREARSTRGNAREVAAWVQGQSLRSVTVVTAGFHMPRALLELRRELPADTVLRPFPVDPHRARPPVMLREFGKLAGAWAGLSYHTR